MNTDELVQKWMVEVGDQLTDEEVEQVVDCIELLINKTGECPSVEMKVIHAAIMAVWAEAKQEVLKGE
jgi:uncharacterized protein